MNLRPFCLPLFFLLVSSILHSSASETTSPNDSMVGIDDDVLSIQERQDSNAANFGVRLITGISDGFSRTLQNLLGSSLGTSVGAQSAKVPIPRTPVKFTDTSNIPSNIRQSLNTFLPHSPVVASSPQVLNVPTLINQGPVNTGGPGTASGLKLPLNPLVQPHLQNNNQQFVNNQVHTQQNSQSNLPNVLIQTSHQSTPQQQIGLSQQQNFLHTNQQFISNNLQSSGNINSDPTNNSFQTNPNIKFQTSVSSPQNFQDANDATNFFQFQKDFSNFGFIQQPTTSLTLPKDNSFNAQKNPFDELKTFGKTISNQGSDVVSVTHKPMVEPLESTEDLLAKLIASSVMTGAEKIVPTETIIHLNTASDEKSTEDLSFKSLNKKEMKQKLHFGGWVGVPSEARIAPAAVSKSNMPQENTRFQFDKFVTSSPTPEKLIFVPSLNLELPTNEFDYGNSLEFQDTTAENHLEVNTQDDNSFPAVLHKQQSDHNTPPNILSAFTQAREEQSFAKMLDARHFGIYQTLQTPRKDDLGGKNLLNNGIISATPQNNIMSQFREAPSSNSFDMSDDTSTSEDAGTLSFTQIIDNADANQVREAQKIITAIPAMNISQFMEPHSNGTHVFDTELVLKSLLSFRKKPYRVGETIISDLNNQRHDSIKPDSVGLDTFVTPPTIHIHGLNSFRSKQGEKFFSPELHEGAKSDQEENQEITTFNPSIEKSLIKFPEPELESNPLHSFNGPMVNHVGRGTMWGRKRSDKEIMHSGLVQAEPELNANMSPPPFVEQTNAKFPGQAMWQNNYNPQHQKFEPKLQNNNPPLISHNPESFVNERKFHSSKQNFQSNLKITPKSYYQKQSHFIPTVASTDYQNNPINLQQESPISTNGLNGDDSLVTPVPIIESFANPIYQNVFAITATPNFQHQFAAYPITTENPILSNPIIEQHIPNTIGSKPTATNSLAFNEPAFAENNLQSNYNSSNFSNSQNIGEDTITIEQHIQHLDNQFPFINVKQVTHPVHIPIKPVQDAIYEDNGDNLQSETTVESVNADESFESIFDQFKKNIVSVTKVPTHPSVNVEKNVEIQDAASPSFNHKYAINIPNLIPSSNNDNFRHSSENEGTLAPSSKDSSSHVKVNSPRFGGRYSGQRQQIGTPSNANRVQKHEIKSEPNNYNKLISNTASRNLLTQHQPSTNLRSSSTLKSTTTSPSNSPRIPFQQPLGNRKIPNERNVQAANTKPALKFTSWPDSFYGNSKQEKTTTEEPSKIEEDSNKRNLFGNFRWSRSTSTTLPPNEHPTTEAVKTSTSLSVFDEWVRRSKLTKLSESSTSTAPQKESPKNEELENEGNKHSNGHGGGPRWQPNWQQRTPVRDQFRKERIIYEAAGSESHPVTVAYPEILKENSMEDSDKKIIRNTRPSRRLGVRRRIVGRRRRPILKKPQSETHKDSADASQENTERDNSLSLKKINENTDGTEEHVKEKDVNSTRKTLHFQKQISPNKRRMITVKARKIAYAKPSSLSDSLVEGKRTETNNEAKEERDDKVETEIVQDDQ